MSEIRKHIDALDFANDVGNLSKAQCEARCAMLPFLELLWCWYQNMLVRFILQQKYKTYSRKSVGRKHNIGQHG